MMVSNPYEGDRVPGTIGFPLPGVQIRIRADNGSICGPGETGVLEASGPNLFAGYWKLPERTAEEHREDGFFITGDVGFADDEGRITLEGRSSDMIISGGLNIYPRELELLIDAVDGVRESAVVGIPDPDFGERPVAMIVADSDDLDLGLVQAALDEGAARFKHPSELRLIDELPRNTMGKVQKALLRSGVDPV
jgi:malonyl-CoA/methylmalonyl-CoA synthetase